VAIDPEDLRKHYASLSDDEILQLEREDLTPMAQKIFDAEVRRRGLDIEKTADNNDEDTDTQSFPFFRSADEAEEAENDEDDDDSSESDKTFAVTTFSGTGSGPAEAADARDALIAAGIPCEVIEHELDPSEEPVPLPYKEYRVMVADAVSLQAASVLDTAIFNGRLEADWKTQLESLSDEELSALSVDSLCAGLLDRVERLRRLYKSEVARRSK
jgi:hypothetical protein